VTVGTPCPGCVAVWLPAAARGAHGDVHWWLARLDETPVGHVEQMVLALKEVEKARAKLRRILAGEPEPETDVVELWPVRP